MASETVTANDLVNNPLTCVGWEEFDWLKTEPIDSIPQADGYSGEELD